MKISIGDESLMNAAIHKVQEENILQALKLFAKVDSYESMLNQVGCLCEPGFSLCFSNLRAFVE